METDRLKYFCTIVDTGSLTAAAQLLGLSHSALSKSLGVLQGEMGLTLVQPQGRGLSITPEGQRFYKKAQALLSQLATLSEPERTVSPATRIGFSEAISCSLSAALARELPAPLELHELDAGEMEVKLLQGELDFALTFTPFPHPELEYLRLKKIPMGVFFTNAEFARCPLNDVPFVVPLGQLKDNPLSIKTQDGWPSESPRRIDYRVSSLTAALKLVEEGVAAIHAPQFVITHSLGHVKCLQREEKAAPREIFLLKKGNVAESQAMKRAARLVRRMG